MISWPASLLDSLWEALCLFESKYLLPIASGVEGRAHCINRILPFDFRCRSLAVMKRARSSTVEPSGDACTSLRCVATASNGGVEMRIKLPQKIAQASEVLSKAISLQGECSSENSSGDLLAWLVWQLAEPDPNWNFECAVLRVRTMHFRAADCEGLELDVRSRIQAWDVAHGRSTAVHASRKHHAHSTGAHIFAVVTLYPGLGHTATNRAAITPFRSHWAPA